MQTQPSTLEPSFWPFRPGLKLESTNPTADPPEGSGGTGGTPAPDPDPDPEEEPPPQ